MSSSHPTTPVLNAPQGMKLWSVIVTILGDLLQDRDSTVSGLVLTALIERMGLQPQAMRVALHRLKRNGWIDSFKRGRVGHYHLSPMARDQVAEVAEAVYGDTPETDLDPVLAVLPPDLPPEEINGALVLTRRTCLIPRSAMPKGVFAAKPEQEAMPRWMDKIVKNAARVPGYAALLTLTEGFLADLRHNKSMPVLDRTAQRMLVLHSWRRLVLRSSPLAVSLAGDIPRQCRIAVMDLLRELPSPSTATLESALADER